uniref:Osteopetrosis-associated transmembrane protein 1 n=1 Tax=Romanomermis culicivorax TaxID=13658 RepID=A0A915J801_ROMCU
MLPIVFTTVLLRNFVRSGDNRDISLKIYPSELESNLEEWYDKGDELCLELLRNFSLSASSFSTCLLENSLPARFCMACSLNYLRFERSYLALTENFAINTKFSDEKEATNPCYALQKRTNGVQYAKKLYQHLTGRFWQDANCQGCLIFELSNISSDFPKRGYNEESLAALETYDKFRDCISKFNDTNLIELGQSENVCQNCTTEYKLIKAHFRRIFEKKDRYCSDVTSILFDSVHFWRQQSNCSSSTDNVSRPHGTPASILTLLICIFAIPSLFYLLSWLLVSTKKRVLKKYRRLRYKSGGVGDMESLSTTADDGRQNLKTREELQGRTNDERRENDPTAVNISRMIKEERRKRKRVISYSQLPQSQLG